MPGCYLCSKYNTCNDIECSWCTRGFFRQGSKCRNSYLKGRVCMTNYARFCPANENCIYRDYRFDLPQVTQEGKILSQCKGDIICKCCGEQGHKFSI